MFNPSDLSQLSGAAKTLRGEILEILAASPEPMTCHDIMQVSVLCPDRETMTREVFAMKKAGLVEPAGEINSPGCTRPVWLYRLSANGNAPVIAEPDAQLPSAPAEDEEKTMQTEPQAAAPQPAPKVTTKDIRDLVIAHPGIKRDDVYKTLVFADGSNKKKVGDLISCLISTKHLTQSDEGGIKRLHPGERLNDALGRKQQKKPKAEAKVKAPAAKLLTGEEAKPLQQASGPTKTAQPAAQAAVASGFRCALFTDGSFMMDTSSHGRIELTREDTRELLNYMVGVSDYATNDLNL
jgi:hypothetical protein